MREREKTKSARAKSRGETPRGPPITIHTSETPLFRRSSRNFAKARRIHILSVLVPDAEAVFFPEELQNALGFFVLNRILGAFGRDLFRFNKMYLRWNIRTQPVKITIDAGFELREGGFPDEYKVESHQRGRSEGLAGLLQVANRRNSTLPLGPRMGEGMIPLTWRPHDRQNSARESQTAWWTFWSRTTPPFPT